MRDCGIVIGSETQAQPVVIGIDTVYIHQDIDKYEDENYLLYKYHEYQYDKDEYIDIVTTYMISMNNISTVLSL